MVICFVDRVVVIVVIESWRFWMNSDHSYLFWSNSLGGFQKLADMSSDHPCKEVKCPCFSSWKKWSIKSCLGNCLGLSGMEAWVATGELVASGRVLLPSRWKAGTCTRGLGQQHGGRIEPPTQGDSGSETTPRDASFLADSYGKWPSAPLRKVQVTNLMNLWCVGDGEGGGCLGPGPRWAIFSPHRGWRERWERKGSEENRLLCVVREEESDHVDRWRPWVREVKHVSKAGALPVCRQAKGQCFDELEIGSHGRRSAESFCSVGFT